MTAFGATGYAVLGILYAVLTAMLATSWRGTRVGSFLIAACLTSAVWGGVLAFQVVGNEMDPAALFLIEVLRAGAWLAFLAQTGVGRSVRLIAYLSWIVVLLAGAWVWASNTFLGTVGDIRAVMIPGGLAMALAVLVVIEQLYRNAQPAYRSSIKFLVLGLGGMFAYDLFLYSQALLFNEIEDVSWLARGWVNVLFVPLVALAARRNPEWEMKIFVSRQVVFYTTTLVAVGLYLLTMSFGGYLLLRYGGNWGGLAQTVFVAGAALVLVALLFSSRVRAKSRVFLSKHFFQNKYDYREEWLRLVATLAEFEDSSTRRVVIKAMAQVVDSPAGILWTRDDDQGSYVLAASYEASDAPPEISADDPLVRFIRKDGWLVDLAEYANSPDIYDNLNLPDWLQEIDSAWLVVPLISASELLGLVLLYKPPLVRALNYEDRDLLKTIGAHIAVHLAQEKSDSLLAQAQQFEAYNRLTAFLMHDLKNLIAQQSLIVENAERHKRNPDFVDDALATISGSVTRMRRVLDHLRQTSVVQPVERIELEKLAMRVVSVCEDRNPVPKAIVGDQQTWIKGDRERLFMALTHAVRNAQDATSPEGLVTISVEERDGTASVTIADTGRGMDAAFVRERLFKPFDSTKGTQGVGIGAYQIRETIRSVGGTVSVDSQPGRGTSLLLSFKSVS